MDTSKVEIQGHIFEIKKELLVKDVLPLMEHSNNLTLMTEKLINVAVVSIDEDTAFVFDKIKEMPVSVLDDLNKILLPLMDTKKKNIPNSPTSPTSPDGLMTR